MAAFWVADGCVNGCVRLHLFVSRGRCGGAAALSLPVTSTFVLPTINVVLPIVFLSSSKRRGTTRRRRRRRWRRRRRRRTCPTRQPRAKRYALYPPSQPPSPLHPASPPLYSVVVSHGMLNNGLTAKRRGPDGDGAGGPTRTQGSERVRRAAPMGAHAKEDVHALDQRPPQEEGPGDRRRPGRPRRWPQAHDAHERPVQHPHPALQ